MCHFQISHVILDHLFEHETQCPVRVSINFLCYPSSAFLSADVLGSTLCNKVKKFILLGISSGFRDLILAAVADVCCEAACSILLITEGPKPRTDSKAPGH